MLKEKRNVLWLIILLVLSYTLIFIWKTQDSPANDVVTDVARLMPTKIHKMVEGNETESIKETILEAKRKILRCR